MKKRNSVLFFLILFLFLTFSFSVSVKSQVKNLNGNKKMSVEQELEFNYAFTEATKQKLFGNYKEATDLYLKCLTVNKESGAVMFQLAQIYGIGGDMKKALYYAEKSVKFDQKNTWYGLQLAKLYQFTGKKDSSISVYENLVKLAPGKNEFLYDLSLLYIEKKDFKKAIDYLKKIENNLGPTEEVSIALEQIYVYQKRFEDAESIIRKMIGFYPDEPKYYQILAELLSYEKKNNQARDSYNLLFKLDPEYGNGLISFGEFSRRNKDYENANSYFIRGFKSLDVPKEEKINVIVSFLKNKEEFTEHKPLVDSLMFLLNDPDSSDINILALKADYYVKSGDYSNAAISLKSIIELNKKNYPAWEQLLNIESYLLNYKEVIDIADQGSSVFPENPIFYLFKGIALFQQKNYKQAVDILNKGLEKSKEKRIINQFYIYLGETYNKLNIYDKSDLYFNKAINYDKTNYFVLNNYSYYLALRGEKLKYAKKLSHKTIVHEPENSTFYDTYAWILYKLHDYENALVNEEKAIQFGGEKNSEVLEHCGDILFSKGEISKAVEYWNKALNLNKENSSLKNKISNAQGK